jgi:hypothetical protein
MPVNSHLISYQQQAAFYQSIPELEPKKSAITSLAGSMPPLLLKIAEHRREKASLFHMHNT